MAFGDVLDCGKGGKPNLGALIRQYSVQMGKLGDCELQGLSNVSQDPHKVTLKME